MSRAGEMIAVPLHSHRLRVYPCKLEPSKRRGAASERVVTGWLIAGTRRLRARSLRRIFKRVKKRRVAISKLESDDLRELAEAQLPRLRRANFGCSATAESLALICELTKRTLQLEISKPQLIAAWTALQGTVAELEIGHGKTTALIVSACAAALAGHSVHFYSIDEATAKRILDTFQPLYGALGLSAGFVSRDMDLAARREIYTTHIVHGTPGQIAVDYMRDRRHMGAKIGSLRLQVARLCGGIQYAEELSLQGLQFALIDDADGHDAVLVANIFHNFTPDRNLALLANLRTGFPDDGRLLLADLWTNSIYTEPVIGALMAAEFLIHSGGDTYSEEDGVAWLNETGWRKVAFQPLAGPVSLLVAEPVRP